eukprot:7868361-Alexandrium_andersonii.AAC.1
MFAACVDSLAVRPRAAAQAFSSHPPTELGPPRPAANPSQPIGPEDLALVPWSATLLRWMGPPYLPRQRGRPGTNARSSGPMGR